MTKPEELRKRKYIGAVQLADEAARLVGELVPRQERASVSELPDERMVRYYSAAGLISPPEARQGSSGVYGYRHLLELLAIKRLQAEHLPIRKIKELVEGKSERELERLLGVSERKEQRNAARLYLDSLLSARRAEEATAALHSTAADSPSYGLSEPSPSTWSRIEIEPGLEMHVRDDYRLADDLRTRQRLARIILNQLGSHGKEPGK